MPAVVPTAEKRNRQVSPVVHIVNLIAGVYLVDMLTAEWPGDFIVRTNVKELICSRLIRLLHVQCALIRHECCVYFCFNIRKCTTFCRVEHVSGVDFSSGNDGLKDDGSDVSNVIRDKGGGHEEAGVDEGIEVLLGKVREQRRLTRCSLELLLDLLEPFIKERANFTKLIIQSRIL